MKGVLSVGFLISRRKIFDLFCLIFHHGFILIQIAESWSFVYLKINKYFIFLK